MFQIYSGMDIFYAEKEISLFSVATFFLTVPQSLVGGIIQVFRNIRAWKKLIQKKGISLLSVGTFICHSGEELREGN